MGIDDTVLSVIFGESLPDDPLNQELREMDMNERIRRELDSYGFGDQNHWQPKLLQRIARELGILVHQLCEQPGAFATYLNMSNQIGNEYAGMPLDRRTETKEDAQSRPSRTRAPSTSLEDTNNDESIPSPHFSPTLPEPSGREHAAQWGIEDDDDRMAGTPESVRLQQEKDYWESDLDVMMVFRYLRNRFGRSGNNSSSNSSSATTTAPSSTTASRISHRRQAQSQDASRRAAIIRQHHPLVAHAHSRSEAQTRRQSQHSAAVSGTGTGISSPILRQNFRRPSSSCASHSAKLSTISSRRTMTGSSRNYWDIGGSVDSGSAIAPVGGGMGAWGDV